MKKEPLEADISFFGNEAKVRWFIDGKKYAFRCNKQDLEALLTEEGKEIKKVIF